MTTTATTIRPYLTAIATPGPQLTLSTPGGLRELSARKVMLATGAREKSRSARMIGGTRPAGVLSTGALQGLVYLDGIKPFNNPVVLGTELVAFSALLTCRHLRIKPLAMIEEGARVTAFRPASFFPGLLGTELLLETELVAIRGDRQVEEVVLRGRSGTTRTLATDGVIVSGQFLPEASLLAGSHIEIDPQSGGPVVDQFGRTSDPNIFAAGNLLRAIETARWSWEEGRASARAIACSLDGALPVPSSVVRVQASGALKYVVPQRLVEGPAGGPSRFQLRVGRAVRGTLRLEVDGREIWSTRLRALPEQRITVPLSVLPPGSGARAAFSIEEG